MFFDRTAQSGMGSPAGVSRTKVFAGPSRGLIRNESLAATVDRAAEKLDNFFPTPQGARMRRGSALKATVDAAVVRLLTYNSGDSKELFATDADSIYDVTSPADPAVAEAAVVTGLTNGNWSAAQFANVAGDFLLCVNGADDLELYDGSVWLPVDTVDIFSLPYDAETGAFTVGETVTGGTSGATATIVQVVDAGTTGTLYVKSIASGPFQNDEAITDGTTGAAVANIPSGVGTSYTGITGVATADLSHVWAFKKRVFFVEGGTLSAWYLASLAITGAATEFPLKGVFRKGGALLFGATWSQDAGDGFDDYCAFVSTEGEVAVYQGDDPASWSLVGVYQIGKPLGKDAHFRAGGDLGILCDDGIIPLSAAVAKTGAALSAAAITYPVEDEWRQMIRDREGLGNFGAVLWHREAALMVNIPVVASLEDIMLVANSRTGAWCHYTGWTPTCLAVLDDKLYFGTGSGTVVQGETTGADQGASYSCVWVPRFDMLKSPDEKAAVHARVLGRVRYQMTPQLFAAADYVIEVPTPLPADGEIATSLWGSGIWGTSVWGGGAYIKETLSSWQAVAASGVALAPGLQITTGRTVEPEIDVIALHMQYEGGQVMG